MPLFIFILVLSHTTLNPNTLNLGQDCMQSPFNWYVAIQSHALATQKNQQNPHP